MQRSRQLIEDALNSVRSERVPIFDLLCNDAIIEHFAGCSLNGTDDKETVIKAIGKALDGTPILFMLDQQGRTWIDEVGNEHTAARWTEWVSKPAMNDDKQWAEWAKKDIERLDSEPEPSQSQIDEILVEQLELKSRLNDSILSPYVSTGFNHAVFGYHCGLEHFSFLMMLQPELTRRWMEAIRRSQLRRLKAQAHRETSPLGMIWCDIAYKGGLMASKDSLAKIGLFEDVEELCEAFHQKGMKAIWHSDGDINEIIDDLISAGIDGLNPIDGSAGMDIFALRRRYPHLIFTGGIPTEIMVNGTADEVHKEVRTIISEVGSEGHLLLGDASGELNNEVPLKNFLALHDEVMRG